MINWPLSYSKIFRLTILSFMVGVTAAEFFKLDYFLIFCFGLFLILLFFILLNNIYFRVIILLVIFFIFGFWRLQISLPDYHNQQNIYYYNNNWVSFDGKIENIDRRVSYQQLIIVVTKVQNNFSQGKVIATLPLYPEYKYGDVLKVDCKLKAPASYNGFDYGRYLSRWDIYSTCYYPHVASIGHNQDNFKLKLFSLIYFIKTKLGQSLSFFIPEPESSLLQAMILGTTGGLPKDISSILSNVGLSHVIAISGMHMVIITVVIMQLAIALGVIRQKSFWVAFFVVIFYVAMIGFLPSAVRGAIMALLFLYAQKIGRLSYSINALLLSALVMLLFNPKLLLYDVGFQLSFVAVLGLLYILPILKEKSKKLPEFWQIKNILITTFSAQIATQPLIIFYFHKVSLVSLLANILVLPIAPFLMIWGFINSVIGLFFSPLGYLMGYISYLATNYMIFISTVLNNLPAAYFKLEVDSLFLAAIFYFLIIIFIIKNKDLIIDN